MTRIIKYDDVAKNLPPAIQGSLLPEIRAIVNANPAKLIVLDDDPTGCQTVHNVPIYTHLKPNDLLEGFLDADKVIYFLTNSRSLPQEEAAKLYREIGANLRRIADVTGIPFSVVSRSDSTLRGHYPAETDALLEGMQTEVDGVIMVPFFEEGGRITFDDIHWVRQGDILTPANETPFAQDPSFGYQSATLPEWVEEKTGGSIRASEVRSIPLDMLRRGDHQEVAKILETASRRKVFIVNAVDYCDLEVFVKGLLKAEQAGKTFLYRTAASFVRVRGGILPSRELSAESLINNAATTGGGVIIVGSYVPQTTRQLKALLRRTPIQAISLDVQRLVAGDPEIEKDTIRAINRALADDENIVLFTSRDRLGGRGNEAISLGQMISTVLVNIVRNISFTPRFLIAKGGITSSDIATRGLDVRRALVLGQALPGVPVWRLGAESKLPGQPYIVFPGNVGNENSLAHLVEKILAVAK